MVAKLELFLPETVDTLKLSAAVKVVLAASLSKTHIVNVTIVHQLERPTLQIKENDKTVELIEPNSIVRYLISAALLDSELISFEELQIHSIVEQLGDLDESLCGKLEKLLPEDAYCAESIILFGDLLALVMAKGKSALASHNKIMSWYQNMMGDSKVKAAIIPALQLKHLKPKKSSLKNTGKTKMLSVSTGLTNSDTATTLDSTLTGEAVPTPVIVPTVDGPTVDSSVKMPPPVHPILPDPKKRNVLITSALPYVNNVPHLGNITGSTLSADFFSRYCKARGYNTLYICGTDEYGTATETKALEEKVTPLELCTYYHKIHKQVYDWFQIEFDHFGRTSTEQQTEIAQDMFTKLYNNGYLLEKSSVQLYCDNHKGFLADRYVEGTCPKCNFDDARGDQCDGCGQLLDPLDLIKPRCKLDNSGPVKRDTKHTYLRLDMLQPQLEEWLSTKMSNWPKNAQTIVQNWLKEGLRPRAITRDLKWGTPVPLDGYENKVLYVWFDAPIGYPSITANYSNEWKQWWKPEKSDDIELYQFMGKDNAPFHAVVFPSSEIGSKDNWKLVDYLVTTEFLNYEGGKFSKSRNIGVFGTDAQKTGISPSVWRYYLASARPETGDSQFSWSEFVTRNNSELLANLGNFVNRVIKFAIAKYNGGVPEFEPLPNTSQVYREFQDRLSKYLDCMEKVQIRDGIEAAMRFSSRGNQYLQDSKLDNNLFVMHPRICAQLIGTSLNMIYILSSIIYPFMPETAKSICEQLNVPIRTIPDKLDFTIKPGHKLGKVQYLFSRIDPAKIDEWLKQFGGGASLEREIEAEKKAKKEKKLAKKLAMKNEIVANSN